MIKICSIFKRFSLQIKCIRNSVHSLQTQITLKVGQIERNVLTNFKGIETTSEENRKLILDFSIYIADGKMDEAFRCIRSIQSETVWENLAKKCVQTGRLDVAKICLGKMKVIYK